MFLVLSCLFKAWQPHSPFTSIVWKRAAPTFSKMPPVVPDRRKKVSQVSSDMSLSRIDFEFNIPVSHKQAPGTHSAHTVCLRSKSTDGPVNPRLCVWSYVSFINNKKSSSSCSISPLPTHSQLLLNSVHIYNYNPSSSSLSLSQRGWRRRSGPKGSEEHRCYRRKYLKEAHIRSRTRTDCVGVRVIGREKQRCAVAEDISIEEQKKSFIFRQITSQLTNMF